jgi:hypothetical protein
MSTTKADYYKSVMLPKIVQSERNKMIFFDFICHKNKNDIPGVSPMRRQIFLDTHSRMEFYERCAELLICGLTVTGLVMWKPLTSIVQKRWKRWFLYGLTSLTTPVLFGVPLAKAVTSELNTELQNILNEVDFSNPDLIEDDDYHKYKDSSIESLVIAKYLFEREEKVKEMQSKKGK